MNDIQPVLDLLSGKFHWLPALLTWIGAAKLLFHFIGGWLTGWAASVVVWIVDSPDPDDDHFLLLVLDSGIYKFVKFLLGLFSLPLPSRADYDAALNRKGLTNAAKVGVILFAIGLAAFGCATASYNAQVFNTENLAADLAKNATSSFNAYYHATTNALNESELAKIEGQRQQLYAADREFASVLSTVDALRETYFVNAADTNKTALAALIITAQAQSSNIVALVREFTGKK